MAISELQHNYSNPEYRSRTALLLDAKNPEHQRNAAELIARGEPLILPYNGIYALVGAVDNPAVSDRIISIKNRPADKGLVAIIPPEDLAGQVKITPDGETKKFNSFVDLDQVAALDGFDDKTKRLEILMKWTHALGVILPASDTAPEHLVQMRDGRRTILDIWTEYSPIRNIVRHLQIEYGERGIMGTSANTAGQGTHFDARGVWDDFKNRGVAAIMTDDFSHLSEERRKSTSVIDLSIPKTPPLLHRDGNASRDEINRTLRAAEMSHLGMKENIIFVKKRT